MMNIETSTRPRQVKYNHSPKGVATRKRFAQTTKDKIRRDKYNHSSKGLARKARHKQTLKYSVSIARCRAKRREQSTNPDLYALRVECLHLLQEPCTICGKLYEYTHQIDHIIPLALEGTDEWSNLQSLCRECHRVKTNNDVRNIAKARKLY